MLNKLLLLPIFVVLLVGTTKTLLAEPSPPPARSSRAALDSLPAIPLAFEKNRGQAAPDILFLARSGGRAVALKADHASMHIKGVPEPFVMRWDDAAEDVEVESLDEKRFKKNYQIGTDKSAWMSGVRSYGRVRYHDVYPNIDLDFYSLDGKLEYDFIVRPGGDPSRIALRFEGTEAELDAKGALRLEAMEGAVWHAPPYVYQEQDGERREIRGAFTKDGDAFGFDVEEYDLQAALVIDPVFAMASFVGGAGDDLLLAGLFDTQGDLWVVGQTDSIDLTGKGGESSLDAVFAWYVSTQEEATGGLELKEVTTIGGSGDDVAKDITERRDGTIVAGGDSDSPDHPFAPAQGGRRVSHVFYWRVGEESLMLDGQALDGDGARTFGGFARSPHLGWANDLGLPDGFDRNLDGTDEVWYWGDVDPSGQPSFNNITQLDEVIDKITRNFKRVRELHILKALEGITSVGGLAHDPNSGNMLFAGSSNVGLLGANKPGNPGVFKQLVGVIDTTHPSPSSFMFPVPAGEVTFINDGSAASTDIFIDDVEIWSRALSPEEIQVLTAGTERRQDGSITGIIDRTACTPGSTALCLNNERFTVDANWKDWNITSAHIDSTLNVVAAGHRFDGVDRRLGLRKINLETGEIYDEALGEAIGLGFGTTLATSANRAQTAFLGAADANQGFPIDQPDLLAGFNGGFLDGYLAVLDCLQLNPMGIVTAGQFEWAPIVPYGAYTIFFDWPRIPGLILPPLVDGRFPKEVEGFEVLLNGRSSATTALSPTQVNFVAHGDIVVGEDCTLQLRYTDPVTAQVFESNTVTMPTAPTWFNAFELGGAGAIIHANGVMSRDNPIPNRSAFALFGGGLGTFGHPEIESCDLTPRDQVFNAESSLPELNAVLEDGTEFDIDLVFAGPSPGSTPALAQVNGVFSEQFWVFCAATTNVEFTIVVTDTATNSSGQLVEYFNPLGQAAQAITDTEAFATCP